MTTVNPTTAKAIAVHAALGDQYPAAIAALLKLVDEPGLIARIVHLSADKVGVAPEMIDREEFAQSKAMKQVAEYIGEAVGLEAHEISVSCELLPTQSDTWDCVGALLARDQTD